MQTHRVIRARAFGMILAFASAASAAGEMPCAFIHLFEWTWIDIARECERLGRELPGVGVLVPSPAEHAVRAGRPWYERYQPVSYRLVSRGGSREAFESAVTACRAAGVPVLVDAVLNHMASPPRAGEGRGTAGSTFGRYLFPGLFEPSDFNRCGLNADDTIEDYNDRWQVQHCNLHRLSDLRTSLPSVQGKIRGYLQELMDLGVSGFRLDAAKHVPIEDLEAIFAGLSTKPAVFSEVIDYGRDPVAAGEYAGLGHVTDFRFSARLNDALRGGGLARLARDRQPLLALESTTSFVDNHDLQREAGRSITFRDRQLFELAHAFLLAWPSGSAHVAASYEFTKHEDPPPSGTDGNPLPALQADGRCAPGWACEHRWPRIEALLRLRLEAGASPLVRLWTSGADQVAFGRGDRAYVAINASKTTLARVFETDLPAGRYCDVFDPAPCSRETALEVDASGLLKAQLGARSALALHVGARPR